IACLCTSIVLSACCIGFQASAQMGPKEAEGNMVGSILGGFIGSVVPGGNSVAGQLLKSQAGTIGGLVGGSIGAALDEEDRRLLERATRNAIVSGATRNSNNDKTGVRITVTPTAITKGPDGNQCRTANQEVILKDGRMLKGAVSACKGADGKWNV